MDTFYLDNNNNLIVTNDFVLKSGLEAIKQDAKTLLLMFQTENPLFLPEGIEWYNLANENNLSLMQNRVRQRLLEDDRIRNVKNIQLAIVEDKLQIKATIYTTEGVIDV
ncbi:hypothetical protein [uncultured Helicobacter sp.]|uniref:hypothetical protein n=1 Tax=uncultured Helicobacter sp. TaxID=175537 RepID=UPI0026236B2C|nr:hypothetical protein [uncultured Helicobacter sp.]